MSDKPSSYAEIADFWPVLFPALFVGDRHVVILKAYCDESEDMPARRVFVVAGGLSPDGGWEHFEPRWKAVLDEFGVGVFHMTDFENRRPPFDWDDNDRRVRFITSLIDVACETRPGIFAGAAAISLGAYNALTDAERERIGDPYTFCAQWYVRQVGAFLTTHQAKGLVAYTFENRRGFGKVADALNEAVRMVGDERRLASIAGAPKDKFLPLQLADLLAYEAMKDALREIGASDIDVRKSLRRLRDGLHMRGYLFDRHTLKRTLETGLEKLSESDLAVARKRKGIFQDRPE